jgi:hypothetical protein
MILTDIISSVSKSSNITKQKKIDSTITLSWINWSIKSQNILFKTSIKGIGDGEQKVAAELDTFVLGQNSCFDMKIIIENIEYECDVKKLDNYTFNTGVKGRNALRPIKTKITDLLNSFTKILTSHLLTLEEKTLLQTFEDISPDELCVSNIQKLNKICFILNNKRKQLMLNLPITKSFINNDGCVIEINLFDYYQICLILKQEIPVEFDEFKNKLILLNNISHEYIINPNELQTSLNDLIFIFTDLKLIFVDEKKGYYIVDSISKISFERITRGHPRFRLVL